MSAEPQRSWQLAAIGGQCSARPMQHIGSTFQHVKVILDGNDYRDCKFIQCDMTCGHWRAPRD